MFDRNDDNDVVGHQATRRFYSVGQAAREPVGLDQAAQLQGKPLSYNNLLDADGALALIRDLAPIGAAAAVFKHVSPCGVACSPGQTPEEAELSEVYRRAREADAESAFGGIVALSGTVDEATAKLLAETFLEVVIAPGYTDAARRVLARKKQLRALELPVYDGDLEASSGVPPGAHQLRDAIADSDGLLVVTPEYNGFPPPLVINAFDWLSRVPAGDSRPDGLKATAGKPVALLSASPGLYGGLRSINFLRQYLQMAFQMVVVPQQFTLGRAHEAFGPDGELKDPKASQSVVGVVSALAALAGALRGAEARGR